MVTVDEAYNIVLESVTELGSEQVPILDSFGRVLRSDIVADINIPPLDNSAMDGYAIACSDTAGASREDPVILPVTGEVQAGGDYKSVTVSKGAAVRIMTGAPVPSGADSVIQFEDTEESDGKVRIFRKVKLGENIRLAGEDIKSGDTVLQKGRILRSADIGLLASLNRASVDVYKRPRVALISTGDEIEEIGAELKPGSIRNSNAYSIMSELKKYNIAHEYLGIVRDNPESTREKLTKAMEFDAVITTGGVSMGKYDFVREVMTGLGIEIKIEAVKMKPGKPLAFGAKGEKLFFGLPGNPVSAMVAFMEFVRPALLRMMGADKIGKPRVFAILDEDIKKKPGRRHFIRGIFTVKDGEFHVSTTGDQGSGILRSMSGANCLVIVPEEADVIKKGERILIELICHEEV